MIHYEYIDPADAKPGDYMVQAGYEYLNLYACITTIDTTKKISCREWFFVKGFELSLYQSEIIDGKPTPALIARFTTPSAGKGKSFEDIDGTTLIKTKLGILRISGINHRTEPLPGTKTGYIDYYYFFVHQYPAIEDIHERYTYNSKEKAEAERARLIEWLEEA